MLEKIEIFLHNDLAAGVIKGASLALAVLFVVLDVAAFILALTNSPWWFLAVFVCTVITGGLFGLFGWLDKL